MRRIQKYLKLDKAKLLYSTFVNSLFSYALVIWIFCGKTYYQKTKKIHHKALKIVFSSDKFYAKLLARKSEVSIHQEHLCMLFTEIYKAVTNNCAKFMYSYFIFKGIPYELRCRLPPVRFTYFGTNSIHFKVCLAWNGLPSLYKNEIQLLNSA